MITIHELNDDDWATWRRLRQAALADAPHAFGSTLEEWTGDGNAEMRWRARLVSVPFNIVANRGGRSLGMAIGTAPLDGEVELISMWVAPEGRSSGIDEELVEAVARWAMDGGANRIALDVRQSNHRAIAFYVRNGFIDDGWSSSPDAAYHERRMDRLFTSR